MRSLFAVLRQLILPAGSLPSAPQLVLGPSPIPPELIAYYALETHTVSTGILWRQDLTNYDYDVLIVQTGSGIASRAQGVCVAGVVHEHNRMTPTGTAATLTMGRHESSFLSLEKNSAIAFNGPAGAQWATGSFATFDAGSLLNVVGAYNINNVTGAREHLANANTTDNGTVVTTAAGGAETAVASANWDTEPTYQLRTGALYRATVQGFSIESAGAGGAVCLVRLRKGTATVAGTQLGLIEQPHPVGYGGLTLSFAVQFHFKNTSGSTVSTKLSLTVQGVFTAGTASLYGDANNPLIIELEDIGDTSDHADLAARVPSV